jgi:hypothetical protein
MELMDRTQSGGKGTDGSAFVDAGIIACPNTVSTQNDRLVEHWRLSDSRMLRISIRVDHGDHRYDTARAEVWSRDEWVTVAYRVREEVGSDKLTAAESIRRLAAAILGEPQS